MAYLLDTNVFIEAKNRYYGFDFCPAFWDWIDAEHTSGEVYSIQAVRDELIGGSDQLAEWARARGQEFFRPPDGATLASLAQLSTWANSGDYDPIAVNEFLQGADYYLVGHAHAHGFDVVTHEIPSDGRKRVKIPNACVALDVPYLAPFQMLRRLQARFVLGAAS